MPPEFPTFKPVELEDRELIHERLWRYQPETSELNFTNMFIWRSYYGFLWSIYRDWLLIIGSVPGNGICALPPVGPGPRAEVTEMLLGWMKEARQVSEPRVDRADPRLVSELENSGRFLFESTREHFDYVYPTRDLIELEGKNYRSKRNHINYLLRSYQVTYEPLNETHVEACLEFSRSWCDVRRCEDDLSLLGEWDAIREALSHFRALQIDGGAILLDGRVEAFTLGELLNEETAVIHVEKANTDIRGLYTVINQQFLEKRWSGIKYVNREQDLAEPGLRQAKLSYNPDHMVEKFRVRLK